MKKIHIVEGKDVWKDTTNNLRQNNQDNKSYHRLGTRNSEIDAGVITQTYRILTMLLIRPKKETEWSKILKKHIRNELKLVTINIE